jgi:hypothetical protein
MYKETYVVMSSQNFLLLFDGRNHLDSPEVFIDMFNDAESTRNVILCKMSWGKWLWSCLNIIPWTGYEQQSILFRIAGMFTHNSSPKDKL